MLATAQIPDEDIARLNARIDRLPSWGLNRSVFFILGFSFFFVFYDVTSFGFALPTLARVLKISPVAEALPVSVNLFAYVIGSYGLSSAADYVGRRSAIRWALVILALGSLLTTFSWSLTSLTVFRGVTGLGMGALIALVTTLLTEFSPAASRGRNAGSYNAIGVGLGLGGGGIIAVGLLSLGSIGWHLVFIVGALAVFVLFFIREPWLPESPRWLILHGHADEADRIVDKMEQHCMRVGGTSSLPDISLVPAESAASKYPTVELLKGQYLSRTVVVFGFWFVWYIWAYAYLAYGPVIISKLNMHVPNTLLYTALGNLAFPIGAVVTIFFLDKVQRVHVLVACSLATLLGAAALALASDAAMVVIGSAIISLANLAGVAAGYAYTAEIFPTRARATGMGIGDGLGHAGGAVQPYIILPILAAAGPRVALWSIGGIAICGMFIIGFGGLKTTRSELTRIAR